MVLASAINIVDICEMCTFFRLADKETITRILIFTILHKATYDLEATVFAYTKLLNKRMYP